MVRKIHGRDSESSGRFTDEMDSEKGESLEMARSILKDPAKVGAA